MACFRTTTWLRIGACSAALGLANTVRAQARPAAPPAQPVDDTDALYQLGRQLFDEYAPPEVKTEYAFPTREQWNAFLPRLQGALQGESLDNLAAYASQAQAVLTALRAAGVDDDLAGWLEQRLDESEAARTARPPRPGVPASTPPNPEPKRDRSAPRPPNLTATRIPYYDLWLTRVQSRPVPAGAADLMPLLRTAFAAEGVPAGLAWLAEAESSMNPAARSPAGAKGLFQLMPDTAKRLGLGTFMPDERTNPEKSARAAARYLRELRGRFGEWPLALAAYNAGEGRVARALASRKASDFAAIAAVLPAETRMYVPKVCALVAVRTGAPLDLH